MTVAAVAAVATAALVHLRRTWVVITVSGASMEPTFHDGDRVAVRRSPPHPVATGDVVVVEWQSPAGLRDATVERQSPAGLRDATVERPKAPRPLQREKWMIKRIGAVAGEPVPRGIPVDDELVPAGQLVLLGDNVGASYDSRVAGYFPVTALLGGVVRRMSRA